jgi:DNA invertase Pin-like site-specific DNA recombinase
MTKRVIELVRVSTSGQAAGDRAGIPAQREINRRTAKVYDLEIVETILISDVSGASVLACPEMQKLLRLIESPNIQGVVTKEFSRIIRPEKYTDYALLEHFIETNTILFLPDGPIDLSSKTGKFFGTIRAAVAGLERREILERMQDAKESLRRAGRHVGGSSSLPYGVGYSKEKGWCYTAEATKVRAAFALFGSGGLGYEEIARKLNIPRSNVRYILENPIYTGVRVYDEKRDASNAGYVPKPDGRQGYRKKIKRSAEEVIRVPVLEGIVTETEFAQVQEMIELRRAKHWRSTSGIPGRYTYNGFLKCGDCGAPLYTHTSQREFYLCKTRHSRERRQRAQLNLEPCSNKYMLRDKLETKINSLLSEKLLEAQFLRALIEAHNNRILLAPSNKDQVDLGTVHQRISALQEKKNRILEAFYEGITGRKERDEALASVEREIATYQGIAQSSALQRPKLPVANLDSALQILEPFADWDFLQREERRSLLRHLCPEISVFRYTVKSVTLNLKGFFAQSSDRNNSGHSRMGA